MRKIGAWNITEVKSVCLFCPDCGEILYNETVDNGGPFEYQVEELKGAEFYCSCGTEIIIIDDDDEEEEEEDDF